MGLDDVWLDLFLVSWFINGSSFLQQCFCFVLSYGVCVFGGGRMQFVFFFAVFPPMRFSVCKFSSCSSHVFARFCVVGSIHCGASFSGVFGVHVSFFFMSVCVLRFNRGDMSAGVQTHFLPLRPRFHFFFNIVQFLFWQEKHHVFFST